MAAACTSPADSGGEIDEDIDIQPDTDTDIGSDTEADTDLDSDTEMPTASVDFDDLIAGQGIDGQDDAFVTLFGDPNLVTADHAASPPNSLSITGGTLQWQVPVDIEEVHIAFDARIENGLFVELSADENPAVIFAFIVDASGNVHELASPFPGQDTGHDAPSDTWIHVTGDLDGVQDTQAWAIDGVEVFSGSMSQSTIEKLSFVSSPFPFGPAVVGSVFYVDNLEIWATESD